MLINHYWSFPLEIYNSYISYQFVEQTSDKWTLHYQKYIMQDSDLYCNSFIKNNIFFFYNKFVSLCFKWLDVVPNSCSIETLLKAAQKSCFTR